MAIYHCSAKIISRSSGRSATGAAAYRAGMMMTDDRTEIIHDYRHKKGVDHSVIFAPANAPEWVFDRSQLWNRVEQVEKRKDSQLCREVEVALPRELNTRQMHACVTGYVQSQFVEKGMIADVNFHHLDGDNPHAHILLTTREISPAGFGQKNRDWNRKEHLKSWREAWEQQANHALEQAGHEQRIDHRTLEAQGIERVPQIHLGAKVVKMEQRGLRTERGSRALAIEDTNAQITDLQIYREAIEHERTIEITAGKKRGRTGQRNRTTGSGTGLTGRRDTAGTERPAAGQQGPGDSLEQRTDRDRPVMATDCAGHAAGGHAPESGLSERQERRKRLGVASVPVDDDRLRNAYSGASERILALARPTDRASGGRDMADHETKRPLDRTRLAVRRQLKAMNCKSFEVGIRHPDGRMMTRTWSDAEVLKSISWLKRENAKGSDIYVRPAGQKNQGLILVDDLDKSRLERMKTQGVEPAAVVETSPQNYQAWIRLTRKPLEPRAATTVSRKLAKHFDADLNSADWRHFGRLAGFTNRKPAHTTATGHNPWVLCHEASGQQASKGEAMARAAQQQVIEQQARQERKDRLRASESLPEAFYGSNPTQEYRLQLKRLRERYGASMDISRADYMICSDMAKKRYSPEQLVEALEQASPELPVRKAGHERDYCQRTVQAALNNPDVQKHLEDELNRQRNDHSPGMGR